MIFGNALELLKKGTPIRRTAWRSGYFIRLGDARRVNGGTKPVIYAVLGNDSRMSPWVPSSEDILSDDWEMFETA